MSVRFDIDVRDTPYDPHAGKREVRYRERPDGTTLYKVYINLVGDDTSFVRFVRYYLHETFKPSVETVKRSSSNPDCTLELWMWGVFELRAVITDIKGNEHEVYHYMEFDSYFEPERFKKLNLRLERA